MLVNPMSLIARWHEVEAEVLAKLPKLPDAEQADRLRTLRLAFFLGAQCLILEMSEEYATGGFPAVDDAVERAAKDCELEITVLALRNVARH